MYEWLVIMCIWCASWHGMHFELIRTFMWVLCVYDMLVNMLYAVCLHMYVYYMYAAEPGRGFHHYVPRRTYWCLRVPLGRLRPKIPRQKQQKAARTTWNQCQKHKKRAQRPSFCADFLRSRSITSKVSASMSPKPCSWTAHASVFKTWTTPMASRASPAIICPWEPRWRNTTLSTVLQS